MIETYNAGISTEVDRLRQWMVEAASFIGNLPNGGDLKEVFDIAYAEARAKYYVDKYPEAKNEPNNITRA